MHIRTAANKKSGKESAAAVRKKLISFNDGKKPKHRNVSYKMDIYKVNMLIIKRTSQGVLVLRHAIIAKNTNKAPKIDFVNSIIICVLNKKAPDTLIRFP